MLNMQSSFFLNNAQYVLIFYVESGPAKISYILGVLDEHVKYYILNTTQNGSPHVGINDCSTATPIEGSTPRNQ